MRSWIVTVGRGAVLWWRCGVLCGLLVALPNQAGAFEVPPLTARVQDMAGMLQPATIAALTQQLAEGEQRTGAQIAILTTPSLQGEPIEAVALQVAEAWRLGQKQQDNGILLLLAKEERKIRIEVGYGLEQVITDVLSKRLIRQIMAPKLKIGAYGPALQEGVAVLPAAIAGDSLPPAMAAKQSSRLAHQWWYWALLVVALLLLWWSEPPSSPSNRFGRGGLRSRGMLFPMGGGFGRGGGFGGGGGSFGGGGASGGW